MSLLHGMLIAKKCGGEVYVAELEDANLQAFNDAYHQSHKDEGMLT